MKRLNLLLAIFLFISLAQTANAQERQSKREGVITGRVVAEDGQPLTSVYVAAVAAGKSSAILMPQMSTCDADGNFRLTGLSHGVYTLFAQAPGYVIAPNQSRKYRIGESAVINMARGGVITGRVTDEFGEPVVGVRVSADRVRDSEGKPAGRGASMNALNSSRMTDDRGVYRIFGLEPGAYVVGVNAASLMFVGSGQSRREPPSYHPSSPRGAATEINVHGGEEITGVDIRLRLARGRSISGTVSGDTQSEGLVSSVVVMLLGAADKSVVGESMVPAMTGNRNFSLRGVEDGEYELIAAWFNESMDSAISAPRRVSVRGADLNGIELKLSKLGSVSGRLVVEPLKSENACRSAEQFTVEEVLIESKRDNKAPSAFDSGILPMHIGMTFGSAAPGKDGGFTLKNLEAGRYWIQPELPDESWHIRAITQASSPKPVDLSRAGVTLRQGEKLSGVEIVIAEGAAKLSGKIVPASEGAKLPKRLRVHLIPAEAAAADDLLRYAETPARGDGSFEFKHIAPGKYLLHARQIAEKEANDDQARLAAWDAVERAKLRREAAAAKDEVELQPCQRVKEHVLRWQTK